MSRTRTTVAALLSLFITLLTGSSVAAAGNVQALKALAEARQSFYDATREEKLIEDTEAQYEAIKATYPELEGRAEAYLGALQAVRGKHAFLPHNKFIWAMRGLKRLDAALLIAPDDLESLFIHAAVCHHLPFFFGRGDEANRDFRRMLELIPDVHRDYDWQMVVDVFKLLEKSHLTDEERESARRMAQTLGYMETDGKP